MWVSLALLALGVLVAAVAPRLLARADWTEREPIVALWVWQCAVAAVLLSFALSMTFSAAASWQAVRGRVFAPAPAAVVEAYALGSLGPWSAALAVLLACGGLWTGAMLTREVRDARAARRRRRAELLVRRRCCRVRRRVRAPWSCWRATGPTPGGCRAHGRGWSSPRRRCGG